MNDSGARERIRNSIDESLIVEAAAGTGKTSELVQRIVNVIRQGRASVDRIVAVTFTRKAAGELRLRLRAELDSSRSGEQSESAVQRLEDALSRLEEAHIGTIHAFCAELLRQRPVEANIPPGFEELDEHQSTRLYNRAFDAWIQRALQDMPEGLRRTLARLALNTRSELEASPLHRLRWDARQLVEWRDFPAEWRRADFNRDDAIDRLLPEIVELSQKVATCSDPRNPLRRYLQCVLDFVSRLHRAQEMGHHDYDELEGLIVRLIRDLRRYHTKGPKKYSAQVSRDEIVEAKDRLLTNLDDFERRAGADLAVLLQRDLRGLIETYETLKSRSGKLDFVDLLIRTRNLLRDNADVRHFMQQRFTHLFIDEFQDTDPLQAEILMLLASADPDETDWKRVRPVAGKLFMVGDPKQSIYRFRRADVVMYQELCRHLQENGVGIEYLTCSFRAVRPIQQTVNAAFAPEMTGDVATGQPVYVPLEEFAPSSGQPAVIALPAPSPYGVQRLSNDAIEHCLPSTIAGFVDWLIHESGWTVRDPAGGGERIPIASQHIAILFRRFMSFGDDVTRGYVRALEVRNIPHVLMGARSFHQREEVETVRAALNAIEWPDDHLAVYATLRGSLFAIPDSTLLRYFLKTPTTDATDFQTIETALDFLRELHRKRNWRSAAETISHLLETTRAHAGFALRPSGNQVLANVYRVCDLARTYEMTGGHSFRGFVEHLNAQAESEDSVEAPVLEEGAEGVRVMTVHAAKGLEFPVVILADMTAKIAQMAPDKHVDGNRRLCATRMLNCSPWDLLDHETEEHARDEAEGIRVAYVAATRARDLLAVAAVGDGEREGWLKPLNKALYPKRASWRTSRPAPLCPEFGEATVLKRPVEFDGLDEASIRPGLHTPESGDHDVVWWDPAILRLDVEPSLGLRHEDVLIDDRGERSVASIAQYQEWKTAREQAVSAGAKPSMEVFIATDAADPPPGYAESVRVARVSRSGMRPHGARFGALVHLIFRDVAYDATADQIERIARTHARIVDAPEEEIVAAVSAVAGCLRHPLFDLVRKSPAVHREFPLVVKTESGALLDAVIDLAFKDENGWVVIDFKTDAEDPSRALKYRRQVGWYTHGFDVITGGRATGWLLHV
jgi:ATP-dependent exoDNAse (exonuclease V) beta subunit